MSQQLSDFLPYLLNQAAEMASLDFQPYYKNRYGMLRTEWRVLFHLGNNGEMTAKQICDQAVIHKTKVSRAVRALEEKRFLARDTMESDKRFERLHLTPKGKAVFADLARFAADYEDAFADQMGPEELATLKTLLNRMMQNRVRPNAG